MCKPQVFYYKNCVVLFYRKPRYTHYCSVWNVLLGTVYQTCKIWGESRTTTLNQINQSNSSNSNNSNNRKKKANQKNCIRGGALTAQCLFFSVPVCLCVCCSQKTKTKKKHTDFLFRNFITSTAFNACAQIKRTNETHTHTATTKQISREHTTYGVAVMVIDNFVVVVV